jgi:hypothetical protein
MIQCASQSETNQAAQAASFSTQLQNNYTSILAQNQNAIANLNTKLQQGPSSSMGYNPAQLAAQNTQAINSTAAASRNASQAVGNKIAGQTNDSGLETGTQQALRAATASSGANALAGEQTGIVQKNADLQQENYWKQLAGQQTLVGDYNPNSAQSGAISEGGQAFNDASQIEQQNAAGTSELVGGLVGLGTKAATMGLSGAFGGGSAPSLAPITPGFAAQQQGGNPFLLPGGF